MFPPISDGVVVSESIRSVLFELQKNTGKTYKSSVPVLCVSFLTPVLQNPGFPGVFPFLANCFGVL